jgi:preprotein translocase subunit YajC
MFDATSLFIGTARAADAAQTMPPATDVPSALMRYLPVFLIFAVFYFLLIRPQQKKFDEQSALLKALKKGDKVVILGGLIGVITKLDGDDYLMVEVASGVQMRILRSSVTGLDAPKEDADKKEDKKAEKKKD